MQKSQNKIDETDDAERGQRIAKLLARAGAGSRRDVERWLGEGRIALNGVVLTTPATLLHDLQGVTIDGQKVAEPEASRLFRFHKPKGCVTSTYDPQGRPTIFDILPADLPRLLTVGRLDLNTEGLLLLTNDGELARTLELPSNNYVRTYRVRVYGSVQQDRLDELRAGITVEGIHYGAIKASLDMVALRKSNGVNKWLVIEITEGKNREVRKICDYLGLKVTRLIRVSFGSISLGDLPVGEIEELNLRSLPASRAQSPQKSAARGRAR
jgi:23S rRNA pseudouridine2605 synthase